MSETDQKGFFRLLDKLSPKDSEGNIIGFADPISTYELYKERQPKKENRAKDLSSRSMTPSGASKDGKGKEDATANFLKEQGII